MIEQTFSLENHLIIAMPMLNDSSFYNSVTYLCKHDHEGAFGLIINRPTDLSLKYVFEQMNLDKYNDIASSKMVHYGGPIDRYRGFVIHNTGQTWENTLCITDEISLTMSKDILLDMAQGKGPKESFFALGYAGWEPGQLETEIKANSWLHIPANKPIIFDDNAEKKWEHACRLLGVNLSHLANYSGQA